MGLSLGKLGDAVKGTWDSVRGVVGDENLAMIIGAALAAPTGGMSMQWGAAFGGMAGSAYGGGSPTDILRAGATGYAVGSLGQSMMPTAPLNAGMSPYEISRANQGVGSLAQTTPTGLTPPSVLNRAPANITTAIGPPSTLSTKPMSLDIAPGNTTAIEQAAIEKAAIEKAATEAPWYQSDLMKYGLGASMLLGVGEKPNYDTINAPQPQDSAVSVYYACIAKNGEAACEYLKPASLAPTPRDQRHTFGIRDPARIRGA